MTEILRNWKWQILSLVLAIALMISISFNVYQSFDDSDDGSGGNPTSNGSASEQMNFTFTWGPDTQRIVQGTFVLEVWLALDGENLTVVIKANDDEYGPWDYVGLVFSMSLRFLNMKLTDSLQTK